MEEKGSFAFVAIVAIVAIVVIIVMLQEGKLTKTTPEENKANTLLGQAFHDHDPRARIVYCTGGDYQQGTCPSGYKQRCYVCKWTDGKEDTWCGGCVRM